MINNFDKSSTGVDIKLQCFYDTDLSRHIFEESFKILRYSSYRENSVLLWTQGGDFSDFEYDGADLDYKGLSRYIALEYYGGDFKEFYRETLENYGYSRELSFSQWLEILTECEGEFDALETITDYSIANYVIRSCTGFTQRDYSEIIVPKESYAFKNNSLDFTNEIYSAPINCYLEVNDIEVYIDEKLKDFYNYDKSEVLAICTKELENHSKKEYILEWLDDNLPEYPDFI